MSGKATRRRNAERALHNRIVLSIDDLEEARGCALALVTESEQGRVILDALAAALIVAYGRCFVAGKRGRAPDVLPALPDRYLKGVSYELRLLHDRILALRNREFAHSDSDAASIHLERYQLRSETVLFPSRRPLRAGLELNEVERGIELINSILLRLNSDLMDLQHRLAQDESIHSTRVI